MAFTPLKLTLARIVYYICCSFATWLLQMAHCGALDQHIYIMSYEFCWPMYTRFRATGGYIAAESLRIATIASHSLVPIFTTIYLISWPKVKLGLSYSFIAPDLTISTLIWPQNTPLLSIFSLTYLYLPLFTYMWLYFGLITLICP